MKSLNKYISEKLVINKNFKNTNELDDIINLITDGKTSELIRNGKVWGYRLEPNEDKFSILKKIEKIINNKYDVVDKKTDYNKLLDEGHTIAIVANTDNSVFFYKSVQDENKIIVISIFPNNNPHMNSNKNFITVETAYDMGTHVTIGGCEIKNCYIVPAEDLKSIFDTIVNNNRVVGANGPSKSDYDKIMKLIK